MLAILITAFFSYDQFSLIDIMSFAVMTFVGFLTLFLLIYLVLLKFINRKIIGNSQLVYFPLVFAFVANLPAYFLIWKNTGDYYGRGEATLFFLGFLSSGLVFGLFRAWKNRMISRSKESNHSG
jgi:hypothetical protein